MPKEYLITITNSKENTVLQLTGSRPKVSNSGVVLFYSTGEDRYEMYNTVYKLDDGDLLNIEEADNG